MPIVAIVIAVIVVLLLLILIKNVVIVRQSRAYVIERLGAFHAVWGVGIHFKLPLHRAGSQGRVPEGAGGGLCRPSP